MNELQRKVVPEVWREEVAQSSRKEAELNNALRRAGEKERALLARIDALENGPGCARELQAQLESMELKMSQGEQKQKQRRVMHELLAKESPLDTLRSEGGGRRRAVSMAVTAFDAGTTPRDARAAAAADGASAEVHAEMLARVSVAQRQAKEAAAELATTKAESEKQITQLEKALEAEKELPPPRQGRVRVADHGERRARGAGDGAAQDGGAQFCRAIPRNSAAQLWRDFAQFSDGLLPPVSGVGAHRGGRVPAAARGRRPGAREQPADDRRDEPQARHHRLQVRARRDARPDRLVGGGGAPRWRTGAQFHQRNYLSRLLHPPQARRGHDESERLRKELKAIKVSETAKEALKAEISVFQKENDRLESAVLKSERQIATLTKAASDKAARVELLQRQLLRSHAHHPPPRPTVAERLPDDPAAFRTSAATFTTSAASYGSAFRTSANTFLTSTTSIAESAAAGAAPVPMLWRTEEVLDPFLRWQADATGGRPAKGSSPERRHTAPGSPGGGGGEDGIVQRAVRLADDVEAAAHEAVRIPAALPRVARAPPAVGDTAMVVKDNSLEIAVAKARRDEAALGEIEKQKALAKQRTADSQELRVMKAGMAARRLSMKVLRLGALRHWLLIGMMRAFRRWALALDVGDAYAAALGSIAAAFSGGATALEASLDDAQTRAVGSLLARPAMLGPLAELRRRLQIGMTEAEMLRQKLDELTNDGAEAAARVSPWLPQRQASELLERLAATAAAGSSPERRRPAAAAARAFVAAAAAGARGRRRRRCGLRRRRAPTRRRRRRARPSAARSLRRDPRSRSRRRRRRGLLRRHGRRRPRAGWGRARASRPTTPPTRSRRATRRARSSRCACWWRAGASSATPSPRRRRRCGRRRKPPMRASRRWAAHTPSARTRSSLSAARRDGARGRLPPAGGAPR